MQQPRGIPAFAALSAALVTGRTHVKPLSEDFQIRYRIAGTRRRRSCRFFERISLISAVRHRLGRGGTQAEDVSYPDRK